MKSVVHHGRKAFFILCALLVSAIPATGQNPDDMRYRATPGDGIEVSFDGGSSFTNRSEGLPVRVVYPFNGEEYRTVSALGVDQDDHLRITIATVDEIYYSENAGEDWSGIPLPEGFNSSANITAITPSPHDPDHFLMGTSFTGIFETQNAGSSWKHISEANIFDFMRRGAGFAEEISGLAYDQQNPEIIFFELGFGGGIFRAERPSTDGEVLRIDEASERDSALRVDNPALAPGQYRSRPLSLSVLQRRPAHSSPEKDHRLERAAHRTGIFLNPYQAQSPRLEQHIEFLQEHDLNSVVIDFKDDTGRITYNSQLKLPQQAGAVTYRFDAEEIISTLHENDIYVIARIVVFKDKPLYDYDNNRYAVWDSQEDRPWGDYRTETDAEGNEREYIREHWVDTFSEDVWAYNIDIANELEDLGVDEIQFDYIRFPSDGPVRSITHRFRRDGMRRVDALASFLRRAREKIDIPISTDVFGFNAWYRTGYLGQDIEALSEYIDVVSPMSYPSHFSRDFHAEMTYFDRAEFIYQEGSRRADEMVGESVLIRPYVQAFLIGGELNYEIDEYTEYLRRQLEGTLHSPASGFTLWNMSGRYYMVTEPLQPFTKHNIRSGSGDL